MGLAAPVSVKGVLRLPAGFLLLRNDRAEWELPGGRPEPAESLPAALAREIREETGLRVTVGPHVDAWPYRVLGRTVHIATYACRLQESREIRISAEHVAHGCFGLGDLPGLALPTGYADSIRRAVAAGLV